MRNVSRALLLIAVFASGSAAQAPSRGAPGAAVKIAVIEFTPAANAAGLTANAKRWLQAQLSATLHDTRRFDVYDTRHTRNASQGTLSAINHDSSTAAAVKVGKLLGVSYVLTGTVTQYTAQGDGGFGYTTLRTRLVDVATGRVQHAGETVQKGTGVMRTTGEAEMHSKVLKPAIDALTATLLTALPATQ
jgi:curli biogenesis system outer membrane secretion channel CsgG